MECEGTADYNVDFGGQDNDHAEESEEEKEETRKLTLPKKKNLYLLWIQIFCVTSHNKKLKKVILQRYLCKPKNVLLVINFVRELFTRSNIQYIVSRLHYACFDTIYLIALIFDTINN